MFVQFITDTTDTTKVVY